MSFLYNDPIKSKQTDAMHLGNKKPFETLVLAVLAFYALPISVWGIYSFKFINLEHQWTLFALGLMLLFLGSATFLLWSYRRETAIEEFVLQADFPKLNENLLNSDPPFSSEPQLSEIAIERDELQKQWTDLQERYSELAAESTQTIDELRAQIDQKQQQIVHFENQIHDLRYEIKTLLHLTEIDFPQKSSHTQNTTPPPIHERVYWGEHYVSSDAEAKLLLKQCIEAAQKITGVCQTKSPVRQKAFSVDHFTLDLRLLFDTLREEQGALVSVFSLKDNKIIFANNQTKPLLGYSPEKFVQDFSSILEDQFQWNHAIVHLSTKSEVALKVALKSKGGQELHTSCHLGAIPTGIFRGLAICVAYAS